MEMNAFAGPGVAVFVLIPFQIFSGVESVISTFLMRQLFLGVSFLEIVSFFICLQYYQKRVHYWAADPDGVCKDGDIVLIKQLEEPQSDRVKHYVKDFVFQVGNIVDPVTGRRCRGPEFINEDIRRFGPNQKDPPEDVKVSN